MKFIVLFEDNDAMAHKRLKHMSEHLAFLESNPSSIESAGPLSGAEDNTPAGGIWIVEAESAQAVHDLVRADPFWPTGLRKSYKVLGWKQVFLDGKRQINPG